MNNKTILITGASSDIGMALIKRIAEKYKYIIAHYCHMNAQLEQLKQNLGEKLILIQADFGNAADVLEMIQTIKDKEITPHYIVHLAAPKFMYMQFRKTNWSDYAVSLEVAVRSIIEILHAFIPEMVRAKYGKVVIMCSSCVLDKPPKFLSTYVMTKYQLLGLVKSLSVEYADKGISFNAISPEMIDTKYLSDIPDAIIQKNAQAMIGGALLNVDEITPVIDFLLSEESDKINGENIAITGGN